MAAKEPRVNPACRKGIVLWEGRTWCETASCINEHQVDYSGDENLTDDQEKEIQPKKKISLAEE